MTTGTLNIGTTIHLPAGTMVAVFDPTSAYDPTFRRLPSAASAVLTGAAGVSGDDVEGRDLISVGSRVTLNTDALVRIVASAPMPKVEGDAGTDGGNQTEDPTTQLLVQAGTAITIGAGPDSPASDPCDDGFVRNAEGVCVSGDPVASETASLPWYKRKVTYVVGGVALIATGAAIYLIVRSKKGKK